MLQVVNLVPPFPSSHSNPLPAARPHQGIWDGNHGAEQGTALEPVSISFGPIDFTLQLLVGPARIVTLESDKGCLGMDLVVAPSALFLELRDLGIEEDRTSRPFATGVSKLA